jgi:hypothetical protein
MNINAVPRTPEEMQAFATIMGGLLASGHFTFTPEPEESDCTILSDGLIVDDFGKEWNKLDDPDIVCRYVPQVFLTATHLYELTVKRADEATRKHNSY